MKIKSKKNLCFEGKRRNLSEVAHHFDSELLLAMSRGMRLSLLGMWHQLEARPVQGNGNLSVYHLASTCGKFLTCFQMYTVCTNTSQHLSISTLPLPLSEPTPSLSEFP